MSKRFLKIAAVALAAAAVSTTLVSSASAATAYLTVTTLGRDGSSVASTVQVVNLSDISKSYSVANGKKLAVPAGKYAVMVDIWNPADNTDTLGGKILTISG